MASYAVGVDVGGTFTDLTLVDEESGRLWTAKTPSTPGDPSVGFGQGVAKVLALAGATPAEVRRVFHGTTVATNTILQRRPTNMALITTKGFKYVLEIGRHDIPRGENYYAWVKPRRPVTPDRIFEVPERVDVHGQVLQPLDEGACRAVAQRLRALGVESVAVCLLYSFVNPAHERRVAEIVREEHPEAMVSLSCEVLPAFREFERTMTTVLNAYVMPHLSRYVHALAARMEGMGVHAPLMVMKSNGGVTSAQMAAQLAIHTALSGPAAGVVGASRVAELAGLRDIITIDVGGTSADVCLIRNLRPEVTTEGSIGGLPMELPIVDIHTIGAGGGSLAHVTATGSLAVGPESAGALPGPVCYGAGGTQPTVTDAHLVLGRIPEHLLGGEMRLDRAAAERAIESHIARPLSISVQEAARGIIDVVNSNMMGAIRQVSIARGHDPRDFALVAFGGAGPLHGAELAELLDIPRVVVPRTPGVLSTWGLLSTDLRNDYVQTFKQTALNYDLAAIDATLRDLESRAFDWLSEEDVEPRNMVIRRAADLRYIHQGFELMVDVPDGRIDGDAMRVLEERFHAEHQRLYTYELRSLPVELVNLRVTAIGVLPKLRPHGDVATGSLNQAQAGERRVYFGGDLGEAVCPCYRRERLPAGARLQGPCIVDQADATTVILPGQQATVDTGGNMIIQRLGKE